MTALASLKIRILGSGTSTGVPVIGCSCDVCQSSHPFNKRLRASVLISDLNHHVVIDTGPEFRLQALAANLQKLDAVFYTHLHADHCHGFDDLRAFFFHRKTPIDVYIKEDFVDELKKKFDYAFAPTSYRGTVPQLTIHPLKPNDRFKLFNETWEIETFALPHGGIETMAYRVNSFAYATDFKKFSDEQIKTWRGVVTHMVASGIHFREHASHSSIPETIDLLTKLQVKRGIITHLAHQVDYPRDQAKLPQNIELAYDGMEFFVEAV